MCEFGTRTHLRIFTPTPAEEDEEAPSIDVPVGTIHSWRHFLMNRESQVECQWTVRTKSG